MKIYLPEGLDRRFRKAAMNAYGYGRGSISKAATEAISEWCNKHERKPDAASEEIESTRASGIETPDFKSKVKDDMGRVNQEQFRGNRETAASIRES
jgi:hypothetical protein